MDHSLEWMTEQRAAMRRLEAQNLLRLARIIATVNGVNNMSSWHDLERQLERDGNE